MESTITRKGQTTIPAAARRKLGLRPGSRIVWTVDQGKLMGQLANAEAPHPAAAKLRGLLRRRSRNSDAWLKKVRGA